MELFKSTFFIPHENVDKVIAEITDFPKLGLYIRCTKDGVRISDYVGTGDDFGEWTDEDGLPEMEKAFKSIVRYVRPGSYVEFEIEGGGLIRYDFLYDTVERCTAPYIFYAKREAV